MRKRILCAGIVMMSVARAAEAPQGIAAVAARRVVSPVRIDGMLREPEWHTPPVTAFLQREPDQGQQPTQRTQFWVAYDDANLYVAARMEDAHPDSIIALLSRRDDQTSSDAINIYLDPYHDRKTGYYFSVTAAGSESDGVLFNDDWDDNSWDGVWESAVQRDAGGWTMEMRIPLSQLRFDPARSRDWGINVRRFIGRRNEQDYLAYTPRNESGFVSRFPTLTGLGEVQPPARFELTPYVTARAEYTQHPVGDPFNNGSRYLPGVGADLKLGVTPSLTLDATVNPDFGQVEVDPAVVNLSDVETYYQEKRPFFVEGLSIFNFGNGGANNYWGFNWSAPTLFYSRRIGRAPEGSLPDYEFVDMPLGTHILGAGKLTGKLGGDWNVGVIEAVTKREYADIQFGSARSKVEVEPLTSYSVLRLQRDFNDGRQGFGVLGTLTKRFFADDRLRDELNAEAGVAGFDGWTFLDQDKVYVTTLWVAGSSIRGSRERMLTLQTSSGHYFQRPDLRSARLDSSATSMQGLAARMTLNKQKGAAAFNAAVGVISPGFESGDLGFIWRTNVVNAHVGAGYTWSTPTEYYRSFEIMTALFGSANFDGDVTWAGVWTGLWLELPNYYSMNLTLAYNPSVMNDRRTRGGPVTENPAGRELDFRLATDSRSRTVLQLSTMLYFGGGGTGRSLDASLEVKPSSTLSVSFGPTLERDETDAMWLGSYADPTATATCRNRYLFAHLNQTTVAANLRINWTMSPTLSLQVFVQPLISSGDYSGFKELVRPRSFDFREYGAPGTSIATSASDGTTRYALDPDGAGPLLAYVIDDPDFNIRSLRGNAVLRWEYTPGSTLYLVWTQSRSDYEAIGNFELGRSMDRLVGSHPDNIFMLKLTYWWGQ